MTREQAEALIIARAGDLCARYYQRSDGTILLQDCEVGIAQKRKRKLIAAGAAGLLAMGGAAAWFVKSRRIEQVRMGDVAFEPAENVQMSVHAQAVDDSPPPRPIEPVAPQIVEPDIRPTMGAVAITREIEPEPVIEVQPRIVVEQK